MFTAEEQPLLTGSNGDIDEFVDCDRCMVIDWRGAEEEVIDDAVRFLPDAELTYESNLSDTDHVTIHLRFRGREDTISLPPQPQNNFRVLLRVWHLLQPEYDIKLFRCTDKSDTQAFLLRPSEWWTAYRNQYPRRYQKIFREVSDLNELWELNKPSEPNVPSSRPWWRFW